MKELYLDEKYNEVEPEKARWLVVHTYKDGKLEETWRDLKEKFKDETKCSKCS